MYKTPYDTVACRAYRTDDIVKGIKLAMVEENLMSIGSPYTDKPIVGVRGIKPDDDVTPVFAHPIQVDDELIIDLRSYLRITPNGINYTNRTEYEFHVNRATLTYHWIHNDPKDLLSLGDLGPMVFIRWLTDAVVKKLGLDPSEQVKVMVVTLFYWYSLFREADEPFEERDKQRIVAKLNQFSSIPSTLSMPLVDDIGNMQSIFDYVETLKRVVDNVRLDNLNPALLFSILGGSWFGFNVKETIAVATEHPPTFLTIVGTALHTRSYRKSSLGKLVFDLDKRDRGSVFTRNLRALLEGVTL